MRATASAQKATTFPARRACTEEMMGQGREVIEPFAQWGHPERDHVQPVIEVLAKPARLDEAGEALVGGGDDADIDGDRAIPPTRRTSRSWSTRRSLAWTRGVISPISSRKIGASVGLLELPARRW